MKIENTPEAKARFFALYWGQVVLTDGNTLGGNVGDSDEGLYLLLTPLSQISDEDAVEVARVLYPDIKSFHKVERGMEFVRVFTATNHRQYLYDPIATVKVYNFLISRGYYAGDGTEIEYGWVKLKTT